MRRKLLSGVILSSFIILSLSGCSVKKWEYLPGADDSIEQEMKYTREDMSSEEDKMEVDVKSS